MKKITVFVFVYLSFLISIHAQEKVKHFVFFVHGIAGDVDNFGSLAEAINTQNDLYGVHQTIYSYKFKYDSRENNLGVNEISVKLAEFIQKSIQEKSVTLREIDKISFVVHSQGGHIVLRYLLRSAMGDKKFHVKYVKNFNSFVTLGTPFWGSKLAITGSKLKAIARYLGLDVLTIFGDAQLEGLKVTSDIVDQLRSMLLEPFAQVLLENLQNRMKFVHVAGMPKALKPLRVFVTGLKNFEDDTAVPLPSARLDFLHYVENTQNKNKLHINPEDFFQTNFSGEENFYPVNAFHNNLLGESMKVHGVSYIPKGCATRDYKHCPHPSLAPIVESILDLRKTIEPRKDYFSFAFDVRVRFPKSLSENQRKKFKIKIKALTIDTKIGKPNEFYQRVSRWDDEGNYRLYHTGYLKNVDLDYGVVQVKIATPWHKEKIIKIPVKKGMTSYADLIMLN